MPEEILKEEITFEFPEEADMEAFWADPAKACEGMQRKYIGMTPAEFEIYFDNLEDVQEAEQGVELVEQTFENPYTHDKKTVLVKRQAKAISDEEMIANKIKELKLKLVKGIITPEEREELSLLK